jgi:hypothetical protein
VTDRFQDGRRRHVGNSSECYKMGNYHPILMQIGTQTEKNMLSLKITIPEVTIKFKIKMAAAAILEIEERAIKWAITPDFDANWYTD